MSQTSLQMPAGLQTCDTPYGGKVSLVSEAHTTKTCGRCFQLQNVGPARVFHCLNNVPAAGSAEVQCGYEAERDPHSSRNIFLRTLAHLIEPPPEEAAAAAAAGPE